MTLAYEILMLTVGLFGAGFAVCFMVSQFRGLVREMRK
jgi:hypothetical protein